jgi:tripartite-type tricarboxylate transporter receptor subunit TctC
MQRIRIKASTIATLVFPNICLAQSTADYPLPSKPVRVIVSAGTGGGADIAARMYAQKLSEITKRSFVIDNRPGAGGTIGQALGAQAAPDGYTLLTVAPAFTFAPSLYQNLPFNPVKDFAPVSLVSKTLFMLVAHPSLPARSVRELIALARSRPGALNLSITNGATNHLFAAYFTSAANIKVTFIPYKGGQQDIMDMMAGHIHMTMGAMFTFLPYIKSGKARALAITAAERSATLPDLPTMAESGLRGFEASSWHGWLAPAGTPTAIVYRLSEDLARVVRSPDIAKRLADEGGVPVGSTPDQFRLLIAEEIARWGKVVKDSGIRVE